MKNSIVQTPADQRKHEKAIRRSLRCWKDLDPTTRQPTPKEQKKIDKKIEKDLKDNKDIISGPIH